MKTLTKPLVIAGIFSLFVIFMASEPSIASNDVPTVKAPVATAVHATAHVDWAPQDAEPLAKKCSFNSDCRWGKCKKGRCGGCSFNSDCKGWGKCKKGWCGGCSFQSDCKGFGGCKSGRCKKSPY
jgi:hypothetical protein